jgi:hypothetical protein
VSDEGELGVASWWRSDGITCFISTHTGSRHATRGGFTLRNGVRRSRGSFPRPTHTLTLQWAMGITFLQKQALSIELTHDGMDQRHTMWTLEAKSFNNRLTARKAV